jgi:hypothetical protein
MVFEIVIFLIYGIEIGFEPQEGFADEDVEDAADAAAVPDPLPPLVHRSAPDPLAAAAPLRSPADATVDSWAHAAPAAFAWRSALGHKKASPPLPSTATTRLRRRCHP